MIKTVTQVISPQELKRLAALGHDEGIVSAYIKIDPRLIHERGHPATAFKGSLKRYARRVKEARRLKTLEREKKWMLEYLQTWKPRGRGLVIFACQPGRIWEVVNLDVPLPNVIAVDTTAHTAPLSRVLDEHPPLAVVIVQRDRARIYFAEQRQAEEESDIASEVPGQHDQGGWAQARFQRHIEFHVAEHLKKVIEELTQLQADRPFQRLIVGGTDETVTDFLNMVPGPLSRQVIGTIPVDFKHETDDVVLERARKIRAADKRRRERNLVQQLVDAAEAGGRGTLGIDSTLRAVLEGRVHVLVVAEAVQKDGAACQHCDYFAAEAFQRCPLCQGDAEQTADIIDQAVERAFLAGAHVNTVFGDAREWLLARGGLGALLRW